MSRIITEVEAKDMYDDMLNEVYPEVVIGYSRFNASDVLFDMDPTAYDVGFNDYVDSLIEDGIYVEGFTDDGMDEDDGPDGD